MQTADYVNPDAFKDWLKTMPDLTNLTDEQKRVKLREQGWHEAWAMDNWVHGSWSNQEANCGLDLDKAWQRCLTSLCLEALQKIDSQQLVKGDRIGFYEANDGSIKPLPTDGSQPADANLGGVYTVTAVGPGLLAQVSKEWRLCLFDSGDPEVGIIGQSWSLPVPFDPEESADLADWFKDEQLRIWSEFAEGRLTADYQQQIILARPCCIVLIEHKPV